MYIWCVFIDTGYLLYAGDEILPSYLGRMMHNDNNNDNNNSNNNNSNNDNDNDN